MIDISLYLGSLIEQEMVRQGAKFDVVVQHYVLLFNLGQLVLIEHVDQCDIVHLEGVDDEVAELAVEGEPVEVHRAGDLHPGVHAQLYQDHSAQVVQRESLIEVKTTSVILAAFHMLNLIRNVKCLDFRVSSYPHFRSPKFGGEVFLERIVGGLQFVARLPMDSLVLPVAGYKECPCQAEVFFRDLKMTTNQ